MITRRWVFIMSHLAFLDIRMQQPFFSAQSNSSDEVRCAVKAIVALYKLVSSVNILINWKNHLVCL